jgi:polar amino acid transport system permease protein
MLKQILQFMPMLPYLLEGALITLALVAGALAVGFGLGLPMALGQVYGGRAARRLIGL